MYDYLQLLDMSENDSEYLKYLFYFKNGPFDYREYQERFPKVE